MKLHRHAALSIIFAAACGGSSQPTPTTPQPAGEPVVAGDPSCPVAVPGTSVAVEDTPTGASLVFVTTGDAAEVRKRAAAMATMHNDHHGAMGPLPDGTAASGGHEGHAMGGHEGHAMGSAAGGEHAGHDMTKHAGHDMTKHAGHAGGMITVHSKAATEDVPGGAKVMFTVGAADVAKIQSELRMHAQHLGTGSCKMGA